MFVFIVYLYLSSADFVWRTSLSRSSAFVEEPCSQFGDEQVFAASKIISDSEVTEYTRVCSPADGEGGGEKNWNARFACFNSKEISRMYAESTVYVYEGVL